MAANAKIISRKRNDDFSEFSKVCSRTKKTLGPNLAAAAQGPCGAASPARHSPCRGDCCGARSDRAFRQRVVKLRIVPRAPPPSVKTRCPLERSSFLTGADIEIWSSSERERLCARCLTATDGPVWKQHFLDAVASCISFDAVVGMLR